jgi:hypothetical protein
MIKQLFCAITLFVIGGYTFESQLPYVGSFGKLTAFVGAVWILILVRNAIRQAFRTIFGFIFGKGKAPSPDPTPRNLP